MKSMKPNIVSKPVDSSRLNQIKRFGVNNSHLSKKSFGLSIEKFHFFKGFLGVNLEQRFGAP